MATVITNMLSAIPWIGQDFVQLIIITYINNTSILILHAKKNVGPVTCLTLTPYGG